MMKIGVHYIAEFVGCDANKLRRREDVEPLLIRAAEAGDATILAAHFHQFDPVGVTGVLLLAESHISIHTWPEHALAAVDVFTCGEKMDGRSILEVLRSELDPDNVQVRYIERENGQ